MLFDSIWKILLVKFYRLIPLVIPHFIKFELRASEIEERLHKVLLHICGTCVVINHIR